MSVSLSGPVASVLASVAQLEYLPHVSQSVRVSRLCPRIGRSVEVPDYLTPVSQSVRAPLSSHWSLSWSTSLTSVSLSV